MTTYTRATQIADIARAFEAAGLLVTSIRFDDEAIHVYTPLDVFSFDIGSDDDDMTFTAWLASADPITVTPSIED